MGQGKGILDLAVAEDRALLRSTLSAAAVQWHGDAALAGRRLLVTPCCWCKAENLLCTPAAGVPWPRKDARAGSVIVE